MGFIDKILEKFRLDDDYDEDDFLDEEDDSSEFEDEKPKSRFFDRFRHDDDEDLDDLKDEADSAVDVKPRKTASSASPFRPFSYDDDEEEVREKKPKKQEKPKKKTRQSSSRRRGDDGMRLNIVNPKTFEDTQEIADALLDGSAVCIILEGLDYMLAQRIVDFSCGACYSLDGHVQQPSRNVLILAPEHVDISGDVESLLDGNFAIPNMIKSY